MTTTDLIPLYIVRDGTLIDAGVKYCPVCKFTVSKDLGYCPRCICSQCLKNNKPDGRGWCKECDERIMRERSERRAKVLEEAAADWSYDGMVATESDYYQSLEDYCDHLDYMDDPDDDRPTRVFCCVPVPYREIDLLEYITADACGEDCEPEKVLDVKALEVIQAQVDAWIKAQPPLSYTIDYSRCVLVPPREKEE